MSMYPTLHGIERGEAGKPVILFLHGFLGAHDEWCGIIDRLTPDFRCLAVDLPGHGDTPPCDDPTFYTMEGAAKAVRHCLQTHGADKAHLVGYSMGGRLALYLALRHPGLCERVVIESASPGLLSVRDAASRRAHDDKWAQRFESEPIERVVDDWYAQPLFKTLHGRPAVFDAMREQRIRNRGPEVARSLRGMSVGAQEPLWDSLPALERDVTVVYGEKDHKYRQVAERMSDLSARIQVVMVPDAGHNAHLEYMEAFYDRVRAALQYR